MKRYLAIPLIALVLAGCGTSTETILKRRAYAEERLKKSINEDLQQKKFTFYCTKVTLIEQSTAGQYPQIYTGFAEFTTGETLKYKVTVTPDRRIWERLD